MGSTLTPPKLITLDIPFAELKGYPQVIMAIHNKVRPKRPGDQVLTRGLTDELWALLCRCWAEQPEERPKIIEVRLELEKMMEIR